MWGYLKIELSYRRISFVAFFIIISFYVNKQNSLFFHTTAELFSIFVAIGMFDLARNTYKFQKNNYLTLLGVGYGAVAIIDLFHTLTMKGIGIFPAAGTNITSQFWVVARYIEALSILFSILIIRFNKKINFKKAVTIYGAIISFFIWLILDGRYYPVCYLEGLGMTQHKSMCEFSIIGILLISLFLLFRMKKSEGFLINNYTYMIFAVSLTVLSETFILVFKNLHDIFFVIGHILKILSFYIMYKALLETNFMKPYNYLECSVEQLNNKTRMLQSEIEVRKRLENQITYNESILKGILNSTTDGIIVIRNKEQILYTNDKFMDIFEIKTENNQKLQIDLSEIAREHFVNYKAFINKLKHIRETSSYVSDVIYMKSGKIFEYISYPLIQNNEDVGKVWSFRDITARKEKEALEAKIEEEQQQLKEALEYDRLKTEFFATISHELKTPLNIILGVIQLIGNMYEASEGKQLINGSSIRYVNMMRQNCYRLLRLINNLIDITKIDTGFMYMNLRNHNIVSIVEDISISVGAYVEARGVSLIFDTEVEEKYIACDADKIERIILNLLSNAIKFSNPDGCIEVNIYDKDSSIIISVKDSGIGIPDDMQQKIFERFRQVDSVLHRKAEGSGIGLSLVKALVEAHGGIIYVKSQCNVGSEFIIELPVRLVEEEHDNTYDEIAVSSQRKVERISIEFSDIY